MLRLRAKTSNGLLTIDTLSNSSTVGDLNSYLSDQLQAEITDLVMKCGFPPKVIPSDSSHELLTAFVKSGDTIVVEKSNKSSAAMATNDPKCGFTNGHGSASHSNVISTPGSELGALSSSPMNGSGVRIERKVIPADNSCLFNSFSFCYSHGQQSLFTPANLRELIALSVQNNAQKYPPEVLGCEVEEYQKFIRNPQSWGGAIEAAILAHHFELEIRIVDVQTNRIDKFGCSENFSQCIYLLYDGIHYDALFDASQPKSVFDVSDAQVELNCKKLADTLKQSNKFTDLHNFSLRCMICNGLLKGQSDAQKHAIKTKHINFREV